MYWVEQVLNGLGLVGPVVLIAISLSLLLSSLATFNVAVGSTYVLAALAGIYGAKHAGVAGMIIFAVLTAVVMGVVMELLILAPQRRRAGGDAELSSFAGTLGVTLIVTALVVDGTGAQAVTLPPGFFRADHVFKIGSLRLQALALSIFVISVVLTVALTYFLRRSRTGKVYRAVAADSTLASSIGVGLRRVSIQSWVLAGLLLGGATVLILIGSRSVSADSGDAYLLLPFASVIAGGMGDLRGTFFAALFFGMSTSLLSAAISQPGYVDAIVFSALFVLLIVRPAGIIPLAESERGY